MAELPVRDINDPRALRALAHPVRLQLLEEMAVLGTATASELAERTGESAANCSWHLRQLARYGYVEEAGGGTGRQRPWRLVPQTNRWGKHDEEGSELAIAGDAAAEALLGNEYAALHRWVGVRRRESTHWREAAFTIQSVTWLTAEELRAVGEELQRILPTHPERFEPGQRPDGARMVRFVCWGVPRAEDVPAENGTAEGSAQESG